MINFLTFFFDAVESFLTLEVFGFVAVFASGSLLLSFFSRK